MAARWTPDRAVLPPRPRPSPETGKLAPVIAIFNQLILLAQAAAEAQAPADAQPSPTLDLQRLLPLFVITGILFYFIVLRPQRKKDQQIRDKVNSMKENDRVVTIGGIHGVVTNVQRDLERVTIRVDESSGTKIKFNMSAVARVITDDDTEGAANKTKS